MAKQCNNPNCSNPRFGGGYCKWHQSQRTDGKKPKPLARTPIKKKRKRIKVKGADVKTQREIFEEILKNRELVSFISGRPLDKYDLRNYCCCAHVLAKKNYPHFREYAENIVLLKFKEHHLFDNGHEDQRKKYKEEQAAKDVFVDWEKLYNYRDRLREEYQEKYGL